MATKITLILAQDQNGAIGNNGDLPWKRIKQDMKYFQDKTTGHVVIMGRKTFESLPSPLKDRTNVVLTHNPDWSKDGAIVFNRLDDAIVEYENEEEIFVIGGAEIYNLAMPYANQILLTRVFGTFDADTYINLGLNDWTLQSSEQVRKSDKLICTFESYIRTSSIKPDEEPEPSPGEAE